MGSSGLRTLLGRRKSKTPSNRPTKKNTYAEALGKRRPSLKTKKDQNLPKGTMTLSQQNALALAERNFLSKHNQKIQKELEDLDPKDFSEEHLEFIEGMSKFGFKLEQIAEFFEWDYELKGHLIHPNVIKAFKKGCLRGTLNIAMKAYEKALEGDSDMIKFWLRNIGKWQEVFVHELCPKYETDDREALRTILNDSDLREKALEVAEAVARNSARSEY